MAKMIFVNLPVTDLSAAIAFYKALGFEQNLHFSDDTAACMVWSETIHVMLLTHAKWRSFTQRPIPGADASEVMLALNLDSRDAVDQMNRIAGAQGGRSDVNPAQDLGFMYSRALCDDRRSHLGSVLDGPGSGAAASGGWRLSLRAGAVGSRADDSAPERRRILVGGIWPACGIARTA